MNKNKELLELKTLIRQVVGIKNRIIYIEDELIRFEKKYLSEES
jgi:hypothetical protein